MGAVLMEALQILKFRYHKQRMDFTSGYHLSEKDLEIQEVDNSEDILDSVLQAENDEDWAKIFNIEEDT
jgi:hypothetical protein